MTRRAANGLAVALCGVLLAAAAAAALDAAGPLAPAADGSEPLVESIAVAAGLVAMLAGLGAVFLRGRAAALLPVAAGAFLLARWLSFDGYYAPYRRRMSDGGLVPAGWVVVLLVASVAVGAVALRWRAAAAAAALVMLLLLGTTLVTGAGH